MKKYGNSHTIKNFKGRTPYVENVNRSNSDSGPGSRDTTPLTSSSKPSKNANLDFSSAFMDATNESGKKSKLLKKSTQLGIHFDDDDNLPKLPPIYTTPEYESEVVYSDLL